MPENQPQVPKVTLSNTKKEMLEAYDKLLKQLEEKREAELKPSEKIEAKKIREVAETADSITTEGVAKKTTDLKYEFGITLSKLSEELEAEVAKYQNIKTAVENKQKELQEIFEIQKEAASLAALIEAQKEKRETFEREMASIKESLESEIQTTKEEWDKNKKLHEQEMKEQENLEQKQRQRAKEDFDYNFQREKQLATDKFEADKSAWEREWNNSKEAKEKIFAERERTIAESETELAELREKMELFPLEMNKAIEKAVKDATELIIMENKHKEQLNLKVYEGENKVLNTRIESLEMTIKEQNQQIVKQSAQLEKSYNQVQDIAVKAVEGTSGQLNLASIGGMLKEQSRKTDADK